ncbi:Hypothetical protein NTJ_03154 [Nesidiocoris tenuis]|uniref:Cystatin domain-containing protein n=1 Tax=Nesidiocoris tenuis TaxID=355587 RepID=A0ABN7AJ34_9HEMI|nr:Hypothetical protein NTJ_03154 [Nesidiocoris tenuis]
MFRLLLLIIASATVGQSAPTSVEKGGFHFADNDRFLRQAELFAVNHVNQQLNGATLKGLAKLLAVQEKLNAGKEYHFTLLMRDTDCTKTTGSYSSVAGCHLLAEPPTKDLKCDVTVWLAPWNGLKKVTSSKCVEA